MGTRQNVLFGMCMFIALVCVTKQDDEIFGFKPIIEVSQHFTARLHYQLEQQIKIYQNLELAYKAYASFFDRADVDLPGFRKYFRKLEGHAYNITISLTNYIISRGGSVTFYPVQLKTSCEIIRKHPSQKNPLTKAKSHICNFQMFGHSVNNNGKAHDPWAVRFGLEHVAKLGLYGLQDALIWEQNAYKELNTLAGLAAEDPHAKITIEEFMDYHVETIKEVADLLEKIKNYHHGDYHLGQYLLDMELDS